MSNGELPPIRILIVHDHKLMRQGLCVLIENRADMRVIGEVGTRKEALTLAGQDQPDIILLDLELGGGSSLDFLPELHKMAEDARILILTGVQDAELHRRAVLIGALGLVMKDQAAEVLLRAIEKVHAGEAWLNHSMTASVITQLSHPRRQDEDAAKIATLTCREREIISVVSEGLKSKQIAEKLYISEATVRNHLTSILSKLGLSDRFELALYAYRHSLAHPPRAQVH
jgi:two-component system, NarL family, nitrate/nitrite response regulator NarL